MSLVIGSMVITAILMGAILLGMLIGVVFFEMSYESEERIIKITTVFTTILFVELLVFFVGVN